MVSLILIVTILVIISQVHTQYLSESQIEDLIEDKIVQVCELAVWRLNKERNR